MPLVEFNNENQFDRFLEDNPDLDVVAQTESGGETVISVYVDANGNNVALRVDAIRNKRNQRNQKIISTYYEVI